MHAPAAADDFVLLHRYAHGGDQSAFTALAQRHISLVYSAAARRVGDRHLAEDITQAVFMILSKKAKSIPRRQPLSAWLLTTVRYAAANALRIESRRRRHEQAAAAAAATSGACSADPSEALLWRDLADHLDDAVLRLPALDRHAILLRYFESRPIHEIAMALNTTEGAIKQRLSRAVEKLRARLDRLTGGSLAALTTDHLIALLASHAVRTAPPVLLRLAAGTALTQGIVTSTTGLTIAKGAMTMMTWTKAKVAASIVAALALGGAGGIVTLNHALAQSDHKPPAAVRPSRPAPAANAQQKEKADNYLGIVTVEDAPPVIIETSPKSGANDVDPNLTELKITFSKEMRDGSWAWAQISKSTFPDTTGKPRYLEDRRTNVLPVKLQPNHTYVIWLNKPPFDSFMDLQSRKAIPYLLVFQTKE